MSSIIFSNYTTDWLSNIINNVTNHTGTQHGPIVGPQSDYSGLWATMNTWYGPKVDPSHHGMIHTTKVGKGPHTYFDTAYFGIIFWNDYSLK